jgi:hypothetical protein
MFSLRIIYKNGEQVNHSVGSWYSYIDRNESYDLFNETFEQVFGRNHVADLDPNSDGTTQNCYGFVSGDDCCYPLFRDNKYYIVTVGGATYDNLCYVL